MQRGRSPGRQPQSDSDQPLTQSRSVTLTLFVDSESTLCDFRGLVTIAGRDRRQKKSPDLLPAIPNLLLSSRPPLRFLPVPPAFNPPPGRSLVRAPLPCRSPASPSPHSHPPPSDRFLTCFPLQALPLPARYHSIVRPPFFHADQFPTCSRSLEYPL